MNNHPEKITGCILAGGQNSLMGYDKALLKIGKLAVIEHVAQALQPAVNNIVLIANQPAKYEFLNFAIHNDIYPNCGALGGIYTGLNVSHTFKNIFVACDLPFVSKRLLEFLVEKMNGQM